MKVSNRSLLTAALFMASLSVAHAGVVIGGTRVIFPGANKEATIDVNNIDKTPYLIQSWVESPEGNGAKAPFIVTPPLYRLDAGQKNIERILLSGTLPQNKESLFWLNIKSIPSATTQVNTLQIAVKTRIKLIYRPAGLSAAMPEEQADRLVWSRNGDRLQVTNPSQYVMNFNEISVGGVKLDDVSWVLPGAAATFALPAGCGRGQITFKLINDYGSPGPAHHASL